MGEWQNLPTETLCEIYKYLSKRDRLTCFMVCKTWRTALDSVFLWRKMSVCIDTDLMEPSTIHLTRCYCRHIKTLEIGWTTPQNRWLPYHHQELTKRAVRYLLVLDECFIQITCIRLCDWFDNFRFKKIIYHLCRFLRHQFSLHAVMFINANLPKPDHIKIMEACMTSRDSVRCLDIRSDYYNRSIFESSRFLNCVKMMTQLSTIRLDYMILSRGVFDAILNSHNTKLEVMEIIVHEIYGWIITKEQWICLSEMVPHLRVTFLISKELFMLILRTYLEDIFELFKKYYYTPDLTDLD